MKKRLTCLLGAGAAIEIGGPSSESITNSTIEKSMYISRIAEVLDRYYGEKNYNFEDLLHLIETLLSYVNINTAIKKYKPILGAFININDSFMDVMKLMEAKRILYTEIWDAIQSYNNILQKENEFNWYINFWRRLNNEIKLDVISLNYDSTIYNSLGKDITDGFLPINDTISRLSLNELYREDLSKIINLHGSIMFGTYSSTNSEDADKFAFEDDFNELYKYLSEDVARERFFFTARSSNRTQSGEIAEITPIITGLRKADKLLLTPFHSYNNYFYDSIRKNSGLLIIGYSFGDYHINNIIEKITALHGENRKIVVITFISPEQREFWHPDPSIHMDDGGWLTTEALFFYSKAAKDYYPLGIDFEYKNPIISKDGKLRIYLEGFKDAVLNHGDEIIEFLTT